MVRDTPNQNEDEARGREASELNELLCVLERIQGLCIGEIAMGITLDANHIAEVIYEATGMNAEELTRYCKSLDAQRNGGKRR